MSYCAGTPAEDAGGGGPPASESLTRSALRVWIPKSVIKEIITGTRNSVNRAEKESPPISAVPIPRYNSVPEPCPKARGIIPQTEVITVIMIGRKRV